MIRARHVSLALGLLVLVAVTVSTGGFTSMTADRGMDVVVADDTNAYLGIDVNGDANANDSEEVTLLVLTNRFGTKLTSVTVEATAKNSDMTVDVTGTPDELAPGESHPINATVNCNESVDDRDVSVEITVSGSDTEAVVDRSVAVSCTPDSNSSVSPID